jgi:hypothetical protein
LTRVHAGAINVRMQGAINTAREPEHAHAGAAASKILLRC